MLLPHKVLSAVNTLLLVKMMKEIMATVSNTWIPLLQVESLYNIRFDLVFSPPYGFSHPNYNVLHILKYAFVRKTGLSHLNMGQQIIIHVSSINMD